jgi:molybdenum cofactor synthesis domain-containing protein
MGGRAMKEMKPFRELIDFETAKRIVMDNTRVMEKTEKVALRESAGRVLAVSLRAKIDVPGFRRGAMDGYAVIAEDTFGTTRTAPGHLRLMGKIFAGMKPDFRVESGNCAQISTGAPMPDGADAVVMVEETSLAGDTVSIYKPVYPGAHVSKKDSDISLGTEILTVGTLITPPITGVLAALGMDTVEVYSRPKVIIFPTGDEIVSPGDELDYGKVYDINSFTMANLLGEAGAELTVSGITGDSMDELKDCMDRCAGYDYALFSGGSSVGEKDLLHDVLSGKGEVIFHGIALKPGKPTLCGRIGETLVFGMPGYPTSCLSNSYVILLPSVRKMARLPWKVRQEEMILARKVVSTIGRHQLFSVKVEDGVAHPAFKESGAITSMSLASGYVELPANVEYVEEGSTVVVNYY